MSGPIEPIDVEPDDPARSGTASAVAPGESAPATRRRIRRDVAIGAVAIAAVALIGKVLSHGSAAPSASHTSSPTPSATIGQTAPPDDSTALPPPRTGHVAACPAGVRCVTQDAGNGQVIEPVKARLPKAKLLRFHTVLLETPPWAGQLWYRELTYRLPSGHRLEIVISALPEPGTDAPVRINSAAVFAGPYVVTASVLPTGGDLTLEQLFRIAGDQRLLTT